MKVGDRVHCDGKGNGTVCDIAHSYPPIGVDFDEWSKGHDCSCNGTPHAKSDHGWYCEESELTLISDIDSGKPIDHFEPGHWYKWVGPKKRPPFWNGGSDDSGEGKMDFILDGKPHKVNSGNGKSASFFDSPNPEYDWFWADGFEFFREVDAPGVTHEPIVERAAHAIVDMVAGKSPDFNPASIKTRSQRRAEILRGLTID